jgi:hypothetical protein
MLFLVYLIEKYIFLKCSKEIFFSVSLQGTLLLFFSRANNKNKVFQSQKVREDGIHFFKFLDGHMNATT